MTDALPFDGLCRLDDRGVIRARGADAATFLQGQLTNDVLGLAPGQSCLAGFCSAKGRLQASFIVWRNAADEFLLVGAADLLAPTLKRLSMFVMRAKCVLDDATPDVTLFGAVGPTAQKLRSAPPAGTSVVLLPDVAGTPRCLALQMPAARADETSLPSPGGGGPSSTSSPADEATAVVALDLAVWRWLDVQSGVVSIEAATVDRFVPQMVNFELVGGVDFKKGCYPGQEVVARSQYRGTTKRRAFLYSSDTVAHAGQDVFAAGEAGEAAGTVANSAPVPANVGAGSLALIELRLAALPAGRLHLGAADGPLLQPLPLPYLVPTETEAP